MSSFVSCLLTELSYSAQLRYGQTWHQELIKINMPTCWLERCTVFLCWLREARYNDCETEADFSWIQRSGDHIWFVTWTICIKRQIDVHFEELVVWFVYRRFWSWRNLQQMNTAQKAMTRTLWKPLIKICSVWYVICPLKSQFKRDVATEFLKIALRNTSEGTSLW